ncbi:MAG: glycosyltransferase family 2 protein, partial [Chitinophagia bacterium]|nr:glycosyltransferase family 2 protein [Chitinophagia bacterium]
KNNGRKQFLMKWGIKQSTFNKQFTRRGQPYTGPASEPDAALLRRERINAWVKRKIS